jgi:hypothetical protein
MPSALKNVLKLKAFIVLWGSGKSGKSETLHMLAEELCKDGKSPTIQNQITSFLSSRKDFRIIIEYKGLFVYLSTFGDSLEDTQGNISFFDGEIVSNHILICLSNNEVHSLLDSQDYLSLYQPSYCISASRGEGRVPYPLDYYGHKMQIHTSSIIWLHKEKELNNAMYKAANIKCAGEIHVLIDRKIVGNII